MLNKRVLKKFSWLLDSSPEREEDLHQFLFNHPVLLDPLTTEIRSKHELGDDFKPDFVIRRMSDEYCVVELENSKDKLFTKKGAFTSSLIEAISQVRDFQGWIADNIAYAQAKLPGIRHPEGLVVIGRNLDLSDSMRKRLEEENFSRRSYIKIVTYDDLMIQAGAIYKNIFEKPISFKGKIRIN
jgi:hypothetical protein